MRTTTIASTLVLALMLAGCGPDGGSPQGNSGGVGTPVAVAPTAPAPPVTTAPTQPAAGPLLLSGAASPVHDPAAIRDGDTYLLVSTGNFGDADGLLPLRTSTDLSGWTYRGPILRQLPAWATAAVPNPAGTWAPDIIKVGNEYRLYYSVSRFTQNESAIGLLTTSSLNLTAPDAGWTDKGPVIQSRLTDNFNAIDPAVFIDQSGRHWMAFGSFWTGIRLIELDPATGLRKAGTPNTSIASRPFPTAMEAPYVTYRNGFYYLFVSFDSCCQGANSTYNTVVGRSATPGGPYLDRQGRRMTQGGGTVVLTNGQEDPAGRYVGRGQVSIVDRGGQDYLVYHAYDRQRNGSPTLQVQKLNWVNGWPVVG